MTLRTTQTPFLACHILLLEVVNISRIDVTKRRPSRTQTTEVSRCLICPSPQPTVSKRPLSTKQTPTASIMRHRVCLVPPRRATLHHMKVSEDAMAILASDIGMKDLTQHHKTATPSAVKAVCPTLRHDTLTSMTASSSTNPIRLLTVPVFRTSTKTRTTTRMPLPLSNGLGRNRGRCQYRRRCRR